MSLMDNINVPSSLDDAIGNLDESATEMVFLLAGTLFGAVFLGPMGATVLGLGGLAYGYEQTTGEWPWEGVA